MPLLRQTSSQRTVAALMRLAALVSVCPLQAMAVEQAQLRPYAGVASWEETRDQRMAWWREARFGMFIHWGLYSAAGGRWDGKDYPQPYAEWIQNWATVHPTEYARILKPQFTAENFDANEWAKLAKRAGMRYAVITTKHHEGFTLFNSAHPYSVDNPITGGTNISPKGRDLIGEWTQAYRDQGLKVGFYYSLLDWQHPHAYLLAVPKYEPRNHDRNHDIYRAYLRQHVRELLSNYGRIDVLWWDFSDNEIQGAAWGASELLSMAREKNARILTNNRLWNGLENRNGDFATPEKYVPPTGIPGLDWEVNHTMNESYGFSFHDDNWKSIDEVIRLLIDVVSKGGNLLLNVGPKADGTIPSQAAELLKGVGQWMDLYSEAIYGTQASPFTDLPFDGRVTTKRINHDTTRLYLHVFTWPEDGKLVLLKLKNKVTSAFMLHNGAELPCEQDGTDLFIHVPAEIPHAVANVVAVDISGAPDVERSVIPNQNADRTIMLQARDALLRGESLKLENDQHIAFWSETSDTALIPFIVHRPGQIKHGGSEVVHRPGQYRVVVDLACGDAGGGRVEITLGHGQKLTLNIESTGGWDKFREVDSGEVTLIAPGHDFLLLRPLRIDGKELMKLRKVVLIPVR